MYYFGLVTSSLMMKVTVAGLIHSRAWIPPSIKIAGFGEPKIHTMRTWTLSLSLTEIDKHVNHLPLFDPMWTDTSFLPSSVTPRTWSLMMSATITSLS